MFIPVSLFCHLQKVVFSNHILQWKEPEKTLDFDSLQKMRLSSHKHLKPASAKYEQGTACKLISARHIHESHSLLIYIAKALKFAILNLLIISNKGNYYFSSAILFQGGK